MNGTFPYMRLESNCSVSPVQLVTDLWDPVRHTQVICCVLHTVTITCLSVSNLHRL
jgi:hypothetical protein